MNYAIFYTATGRIFQTCTTPNPDEITPILQAGQSFIQVDGAVDDARYYVLGGSAQPRPEQQTTLDGLTLSGLPVPSTIHINTQSYPCETDTEDLAFDQPGTYSIRVESWPYLDKEFTIDYQP